MATTPTVSEIHGYPARPERFAEPLFLTREHKKEIAEHLAGSRWLFRADDAPRRPEQPCYVFGRGGHVWLVRRAGSGGGRRRCVSRLRKWRIREVVERWREVSGWWEPDGGRDRLLFRVLLRSGTVLDLAYERGTRRWYVAAVVD